MNCEEVLSRFPKARPPLPPAYQRVHDVQYKHNREGQTPASSLSQRMETWTHRVVSRDVRRSAGSAVTLEIGAGTLNHLPYELQTRVYDVVEPFEELYRNSPRLGRVRRVYADTAEIPDDVRYDRIISILTFEHICDLPEVVARCGQLLRPGGQLRVAIPSEGGLLWRLGWNLTTGLEFRLKYGLDYGVLMKHWHVNTADEIEGVLACFFRWIDRRLLGVSGPLSLYRFLACSSPDLDGCSAYLRSR